MGQSQYVINQDRREFLDPQFFQDFGGLEGLICADFGAMTALGLLLAASNGTDTGDFKWFEDRDGVQTEVSHDEHPVARHIIGRWAGDRIVIVGDSFQAGGADTPIGEDVDLISDLDHQRNGWADISEHVAAVMDLSEYIRGHRHDVQVQEQTGRRWSRADGFDVDRKLPRAPRSLLDEDTGEITAVPELPPVDPTDEPMTAIPATAAELVDLERVMDDCRTGLGGPLAEDSRERIRLAAAHPNPSSWTEAYSLCVNGTFGTLWNAVGQVDPTFPSSAPRDDVGAPQWERVPDGRLILDALTAAVSDRQR